MNDSTIPSPDAVKEVTKLATAANATEALTPGEVISVVTPEGYERSTVDLEEFLERPRTTRGTVNVVTLDDLIRYTKRHDREAQTTLWVDAENRKIISVLDDHAKESAGWGHHRALLQLEHTDEWDFWIGKNETLMQQVPFAEHIEYGTPQIASPDAGELFEMAQTFQATKGVALNQANSLRNGSIQLDYSEEVNATAGDGKKEIPGEMTLVLAPFVGEPEISIAAKIYFRLPGAGLQIGYKLDHPEDRVRESLEKVAEKLTEEFGDNRVFLGTPR